MKTFSFFAICFGISFCIAQTDTEQPNNLIDTNYNSDSEMNYSEQENYNESGQNVNKESQNNNSHNSDGWDRSDYYETNKQTERVQYYSGGHRGSNMINSKNETHVQESSRSAYDEPQFPDIIRIYSGGYYGNNIINKQAVESVNDVYMNNPTNGSDSNDNYQPEQNQDLQNQDDQYQNPNNQNQNSNDNSGTQY